MIGPLLRISDLHVNVGRRRALRGLSLDMRPGETLCVAGETGSGKSLLALAILRLLPVDTTLGAGDLEFEGIDLRLVSEHAMANLRGARISLIGGNPAASLDPTRSIGEHLAEILRRHRGGARRDARRAAAAMLTAMEIADPAEMLRRYPRELAPVTCLRIAIALALICEPTLLIADEPIAELDVIDQAAMLNLLASLQRQREFGLLYLTNDLRIAARLADRVATLYAGQIVEEAPRHKLFGQPLHPYTRMLIDSLPQGGRIDPARVANAPLRLLHGDIVGCAFAPRCERHDSACTGALHLAGVEVDHLARCVHPLA